MPARARSACGITAAPLTRRPGEAALRSVTVSAAAPAVEITVAVVDAV